MNAVRDDKGLRLFLRRLREAMAGADAHGRLGRIVRLIASQMVAEVCSVYIRDSLGRLELVATEGLNPKSIHKTVLGPREGLIGDIATHARPLSLSDAQAHPAFSYRPETGEKIYASFLGVPVLRGGRVIGVLAVQNRRARRYAGEDTDVLETVAMLLAEFAQAALLPKNAAETPESDVAHRFQGAGWAAGIALGHVVPHEPRVEITRLLSEDSTAEEARLDEAIFALRAALDRMLDGFTLSGEHREILEAYRMYANDRGWIARMHEAIGTGLSAEAAVQHVHNNMRARFLHQSDPYLRARLHDIDDLSNRLLRHLTGARRAKLPEDAIVIARNMGPAELLDYERARLRGVVLEEGAEHAHVTIVAKALSVPLVGHVRDALARARAGAPIIADGGTGEVYLNPAQDVIGAYTNKVRFQAGRQARYRKEARTPARTRDGVDIALFMNAGLVVDLPQLKDSGAAGIGLFRTELQFMISSTMPRLAAQIALYKQVLDAAGEKPVVFRTLDIGGDKILPYMHRLGIGQETEENPAMGWRAIRIGLDRPGLLRYQLRALLSAARGRDVRILFPMITDIGEYDAARALLDKEIARARRFDHPAPTSVEVGVMLEVPALLWQLDGLLPRIDFLSIGSNDLFQFLFASDRGNARLSRRYDWLSVPVLRMLRFVLDAAEKAHVPVCLCGERSARPLDVLALVALGFRQLSLPPQAIGPVKEAILAAESGALTKLADALLQKTGTDPRAVFTRFAEDNKIPVSP